MIASILIVLALAGTPTGIRESTYDSYADLHDAGFAFWPGFDCAVQVSRTEIVFSATHQDLRWAIFVKEDVPMSVSETGYVIRRLVGDQVEGEHLKCASVNGQDQIATFDRLHGGDVATPDHISFVFARNPEGRIELASCGWSYGFVTARWHKGKLLASYVDKRTKRVESTASWQQTCVVQPDRTEADFQ